jgi:hypothetical protein
MRGTREHGHQLINRMLRRSGLVHFLESMVDPVSAALRNAPVDDEPESDAERADAAEAKLWRQEQWRQG